jgi:diguanylate cyclase (GGDEF)-like protein/PAS domain S-box-containing protein
MSRWYTLHIKNEILFWFLILALLPLFLLTTLNYHYQKSQYEKIAQDKLQLILNQKIKNIENHLNTVSKEIHILSQTPNVKDALMLYAQYFEKKVTTNTLPLYEEYFKQIINENGFYDLFLINPQGDIVYSVKKENDLFSNLKKGKYSKSNLSDVFESSISLLEMAISDFEFYAPSNEDAAFISVPVYGKDRILGVIAIQIDNDKVVEIFNDRNGLGESGEFYAAKVDEHGNIIATTPLHNRPKAHIEKFQFLINHELPIYRAVNGDKDKGMLQDYRDKEVIATWAYIPTLRWGVVVKMELKEILKPIENLRFYSIVILFFVVLGIIVAIFTAIRHIVEPIEKLNTDVQNFARGYAVEGENIDVDNEIGELYRNFNDMALSLKASQDTIQKYANELEKKVQQRTVELESAKNDLEISHQEMERFMEIIDQNVITSTTDLDGNITKVSQAFCNITGYSKEELIGKRHNIIRHPDMDRECYKEIWKHISSGKVWSGEIKNQKRDGTHYWVSATISPIFDEEGNIKEYTSIRQDITDKKRVEELSIRDQLTKLYNRHKLEEVLAQEAKNFSLILLDIDYFKEVNDTHGHDVGDETLKTFAKILHNSVRHSDIVGRWGGEEFLIVVPQTSLANAVTLAQKIKSNITKHTFKVIGKKSASFGVATYIEGDSIKSVVKRADDALYKAKELGRDRIVTQEEL